MKTRLVCGILVTSAALTLGALPSVAEGWKSGTIKLVSTTSQGVNGGCFAFFVPTEYTATVVGMTECNSDGAGTYYVTLDCAAASSADTGLTAKEGRANFDQVTLAGVTGKQADLYIKDVQIDGFCVATDAAVILSP